MNEPAAAPAFDTLKEARTLTDAGMDEGHAAAIVAFTGRAMSNLATKADLAHEPRGEIGKARDELRADTGRLDTKIDKMCTKLDTKIDKMCAEMREMRAEIGKANWKFLTYFTGMFITVSVVVEMLL